MRFARLLVLTTLLPSCGTPPAPPPSSTSAAPEAAGTEPDWSAEARLPDAGDRANIYNLAPDELAAAKHDGARHALVYPVTTTKLLMPYRPIKELLENRRGILGRLIGFTAAQLTGFNTMDDAYAWLGLKPYPETDGAFGLPFPDGARPEYRMGVTLMERSGSVGLTYGCATCHVGQLFGRPVFGMTARFPRANDFFIDSANLLGRVNPTLFRWLGGATRAEAEQLQETNASMQWIKARRPQALGLDTSLAQVGLSLARRELDDYAAMTPSSARYPRPNMLETNPADSKPSVWWTAKYKTRWLSDGSVVSGNPVHTNFLWNEVGRAADLRELEGWLADNRTTVRDLTAAVFASEAPRYTEFFPRDALDLAKAKRGQVLFNANCSRCHGTYAKAWDDDQAADPFLTTRVSYHPKTIVVDVGTDPGRRRGMAGFADRLNDLAISHAIGTVIEVQPGYVPPPLVGIWARWPYFHNNAAPSLCAVLTAGPERPVTFWMGEPYDRERDFDQACNGYPTGDAVPAAWRSDQAHRYDTRKRGLSNRGHDEGIFLRDGREILDAGEKMAIIEFLKTL